MSFNPANVIAKKRDGIALVRDEIAEFVRGFTGGSIPDYQMSALAMAIYLRGMSAEETAVLTEQMLASGVQLKWPTRWRRHSNEHSLDRGWNDPSLRY